MPYPPLPWITDDPYFVSGRLDCRPEDLAGFLGCSEETAYRVGFCRAPLPGEDLNQWTWQLVHRFHLDPIKVQQLAEMIASW